MRSITVSLAYVDKVDVHGDKFTLNSFEIAIKNIKQQIPVILGLKLKMNNLVGGAKNFRVDKRRKILRANLTVTNKTFTLLQKGHIARLTGIILKFTRNKQRIRAIKEFQIVDIVIIPNTSDVYKKQERGLKRLLKG